MRLTSKMRYYLLFISALFFTHYTVKAQADKEIVQFSGLIVEGDSMLAIPGVHIFVPESGRGASTNLLGFFTLPVVAGDSVVIAAVGFKKQHYIVPKDTSGSFNVIVRMDLDTTVLPEVLVSSFPTEAVFRQVFLTMDLNDQQDIANMNSNLNDQIMSRLLADSEMDASLNHTYYMQQQVTALENRYMATTVPFLDPFAWARFIKAVREEQEKKRDRKAREENDSNY